MRQGGFKPKSHNSGTYWVRANATTGGRKKKEDTDHAEDLEGDHNGDGIVDHHDIFHYKWMRFCTWAGWLSGIPIVMFFFYLVLFRSDL